MFGELQYAVIQQVQFSTRMLYSYQKVKKRLKKKEKKEVYFLILWYNNIRAPHLTDKGAHTALYNVYFVVEVLCRQSC